MKVLKIKSRSMREALARAKRELGEDATVLHTRIFEDPVMFGLGKTRGVEILAAVDTPHAAHGPVGSVGDVQSVASQITEMKDILAKMAPASGPFQDRPASPALERLLKNGVSSFVAESAAMSIGDEQASDRVIDILEQRITCSGPVVCDKRQARVALVGPTGVGKTTTAAKLAAHHSLTLGKRVALLTLDTYRVGAVEQLSTYARILRVPVEVALCPEDIDALIAKHKDKDLIVIDTVGRSPRNSTQIAELARFVQAADPTEVHMVVSASLSPAVQKEAIHNFRTLSPDRLILTKLDECPVSGCILDLAMTSLLPYSYITYGQEVPDDISVADPTRLARLVWEGMP